MKSILLLVVLAAFILLTSNAFADTFLESLVGLPYATAKKKLLQANYHTVRHKSSRLDRNAPPGLFSKYPEIEMCAGDVPLCRYSFRSGTYSIVIISQYVGDEEIHDPGVVTGWALDDYP